MSTIEAMRRFIALFGVMLLVIGIRLYNNGLLNCGYSGVISKGEFDTEVIAMPLLIDGPHRIDVEGDITTALRIIENLDGKLLLSEEVGEVTILYAYSPRLIDPVSVHGKKVNLMIAISDKVSAGTPLLYGSY